MSEFDDLLESDPQALADFLFNGHDMYWACLANVDWHDAALPSLSVLVIDAMTCNVVYQSDPIADLLKFVTEDGPNGDPERVTAAIAALQSGIDRLRAYEAERLKAQS